MDLITLLCPLRLKILFLVCMLMMVITFELCKLRDELTGQGRFKVKFAPIELDHGCGANISCILKRNTLCASIYLDFCSECIISAYLGDLQKFF